MKLNPALKKYSPVKMAGVFAPRAQAIKSPLFPVFSA
jgi:hypothetical protein